MLKSKLAKLTSPATGLHFSAWRLFNRGYYKPAISLWKISRLLGLRPCSTLDGLARSYYQLGQKEFARRNFDLLTKSFKALPTDWQHIKEAAIVMGEDEIALATLRDAWQAYPQHEEIFEDLLNELTRQKLAKEVIELIGKIKAWKQDIGTVGLVWQAYLNLDNYEQAIGWLEEMRSTLPADVYQDLRFRTFARAIRYSVNNDDLDLALLCAAEVPVNEGNINCFRLLAIGLHRNQRGQDASDIVKKMLGAGIPEQFVATATFILAECSYMPEAHSLVARRVPQMAERSLLEMYLLQLESNNTQSDAVFNKLLQQGDFSTVENLSAGLNNLKFKPNITDSRIGPTKLKSAPLVSIIMTCFNDAEFLMRAVNSIYGQTIQDFELFIVDDASQDETFKLAQDLASKDPRIKAFQNEYNSGPYFSKNRMLNIATGKYLAFHDADDISHPQRLESQIRAIESGQRKGTFASMCYHIRICEETGKLVERGFGLLTESPISLMLPREQFLDTFGAFDTVRAGGDSELIRRIQAHLGAQSIQIVKYPLYLASYRTGSLTTDSKIGISESSKDSVRQQYRRETDDFHQKIRRGQVSVKKAFPPVDQPYQIPEELQVSKIAIASLFATQNISISQNQ